MLHQTHPSLSQKLKFHNAHAKGGLHHEDGKTTAEYDAGASYDKDGVKADVAATGAKDKDGAWTNDESASVEYENEEAGVKASAKGAMHHEGGKTTADAEAHGELKKGPLDVHADGEVHKSAEGEVTAKASGHAGLKHGDDHAEIDGHVERHPDGKVDGEAKAAWNIKGHAGEKLLAGGDHEGAEEEGVDLRGEHAPVGQHTQAIDQLAGGDLEDEGAEHQADESESTAVNDNQLPEDLKDVGQVKKKFTRFALQIAQLMPTEKLEKIVNRQNTNQTPPSDGAPNFYGETNTSQLEKKISQQTQLIVKNESNLLEAKKIITLQVELVRLRASADLIHRSMKNVKIHPSSLSVHYQNMRNINGLIDDVNTLRYGQKAVITTINHNAKIFSSPDSKLRKIEGVDIEKTEGSISQVAATMRLIEPENY